MHCITIFFTILSVMIIINIKIMEQIQSDTTNLQKYFVPFLCLWDIPFHFAALAHSLRCLKWNTVTGKCVLAEVHLGGWFVGVRTSVPKSPIYTCALIFEANIKDYRFLSPGAHLGGGLWGFKPMPRSLQYIHVPSSSRAISKTTDFRGQGRI